VLDPSAQPGISLTGGASLQADGSVIVNSWGPGYDQYGNTVNPFSKTGNAGVTAANANSIIKVLYLQVDGGVDQNTLNNAQNIISGGPSPIFAGLGVIEPDPLNTLAVPQQSNTPSIPSTAWTTRDPTPSVSGGVTTYPSGWYTNGMNLNAGATAIFNPGIYADIQISSRATATFKPGVYIFAPTKNNQGLGINGSGTVTGNNAMFYFTSSDFMSTSPPGAYDVADTAIAANPPGPSNQPSSSNWPTGESTNVIWSTLNINASGATTLNPLNDASNNTFNGLLFYFRRRNTTQPSIQGGGSSNNVNLAGTIYDRWANFKLAGGGAYNAQFIVGSLTLSGGATFYVHGTGKNFGLANETFLVE